jgi:hypothetical protein
VSEPIKPLYSPALRMKAGELEGLRQLAADVADCILPRLIVPPSSERDETTPLYYFLNWTRCLISPPGWARFGGVAQRLSMSATLSTSSAGSGCWTGSHRCLNGLETERFELFRSPCLVISEKPQQHFAHRLRPIYDKIRNSSTGRSDGGLGIPKRHRRSALQS